MRLFNLIGNMTAEEKMKSKVAIIGTGMVGMSYAYSMVNQGTCEELVLIDINKEKTEGEAIDLNHGLSFAPRKMKIYSVSVPARLRLTRNWT